LPDAKAKARKAKSVAREERTGSQTRDSCLGRKLGNSCQDSKGQSQKQELLLHDKNDKKNTQPSALQRTNTENSMKIVPENEDINGIFIAAFLSVS
jgi:hypothetical protein